MPSRVFVYSGNHMHIHIFTYMHISICNIRYHISVREECICQLLGMSYSYLIYTYCSYTVVTTAATNDISVIALMLYWFKLYHYENIISIYIFCLLLDAELLIATDLAVPNGYSLVLMVKTTTIMTVTSSMIMAETTWKHTNPNQIFI